MSDEDSSVPSGVPSNRTIQIDALTDVELVESSHVEAPLVSRAPPPLPPKRTSTAARLAGLSIFVLVLVLGILGVHYLLPSDAPRSPTPTAVAPPAPAVRHLRMDDELVIRSAPDPDPDPGGAGAE